MATIGHTLAGLSLAGCGPIKARGGVMPHLWPAFIVLLAHAVDLIEWGAAVLMDAPADKRFLTHSPLATGILVLLIWMALALGAKLRSPGPYLIVAAAVFSHLLLDLFSVRFFIAHTCAQQETYSLPPFEQSFVAEIWLLGFVFVLVALGRAVLQETCPRKGRAAGCVLALATLAAAATRLPAFWVPAYLVSLIHAAVLLRRSFKVRQLWGIVVVSPVLVFVLVEAMASHLTAKGLALRRAGRLREAVEVQERVLRLPIRESHAWHHYHLAVSYQQLGQLDKAEAALLNAIAIDDGSPWPKIFLARLYANPKSRSSGLFRPQEAKALYRAAQADAQDDRARAYVKRGLAQLEEPGPPD